MNDETENNYLPFGLANLGNTCFLNSCLQVLRFTPELSIILKNSGKLKPSNLDHQMTMEWIELYNMMCNNQNDMTKRLAIGPHKFVETIQKVAKNKGVELFTGWAQNDMPEFLLFIMECFHKSISCSMTITVNGTPKNEIDKNALQCFSMIKDIYEKEYSELMDCLLYASPSPRD